MSHIVSGEVKPKELVVVYAVILKEQEITRVPFQAYERSSVEAVLALGGSGSDPVPC
jgi:hypothetical protein